MPADLCESCRLKPAELVTCKVSKSGRHEERSLCAACTRDSERTHFGDRGLLLTDVLQVMATKQSFREKEQNRTKVCPICGNTDNDVREAGVVGCAMCYKVFSDEVGLVVQKLHGISAKQGKPD